MKMGVLELPLASKKPHVTMTYSYEDISEKPFRKITEHTVVQHVVDLNKISFALDIHAKRLYWTIWTLLHTKN